MKRTDHTQRPETAYGSVTNTVAQRRAGRVAAPGMRSGNKKQEVTSVVIPNGSAASHGGHAALPGQQAPAVIRPGRVRLGRILVQEGL